MDQVSRRLFLSSAVAAGGAAAVPYRGPETRPVPVGTSRYTTAQPTLVRAAPVPRQFTPFGLDQGAHAAFPAAAVLPDGRAVMMWRESDGHLDLDGGKIMRTVGDPITGVWEPPTEVVVDGGETGVTPHTGPSALSYIDGKLWLTYFFWHNGVPSGARVTYSTDNGLTFAPSVRVDGGRPWAAISGPVVKVGGKLVTTWYGRNIGESIDTVWWSWSTDNGATWSTNRLINAIGARKHTQEPWALVRGDTVVVLYRDGTWSGLAARVSTDGGTTWAAPYRIIDNATGNSASVWTSGGNIYLVYRHTQTRSAMLAVSRDSGATWQVDPTPVLRAPANLGKGSLGMTYAAPIVLGEGLVLCPIGLEQSLDASRIYTGWL